MSYTLTGTDIDNNLSRIFVVEVNDVFVIRARGGLDTEEIWSTFFDAV